MIDQPLAAFDERNSFLQLVLGMLSGSKALERLLERHVRPSPGEADPRDQQLVDFVLGLIGFSRVLRSSLERTPRAATKAAATKRETPLEDILR